MSASGAAPRLTSLSHGAGCACKLSLDELRGILAGVSWTSHPDVLSGVGSGDDAAVVRQPDGRVLVATTDFFTPLVDDPATWGRIAAANAVSDVYAMGATPRFALNLLGWPRALPHELAAQVLSGAAEIADEAGYPLVGGHSIDSAEPLYGQVVLGDADEDRLLTNDGARPGEVLVLTKAIGTGIATTAAKRAAPSAVDEEGPVAVAFAAAVASMTRLNRDAADAAVARGIRTATDVTGFGLLGHLHRLCAASGVAATIDAGAVPVLPGVLDLLHAGAAPGGTQRNAEQAARYLGAPVDDATALLLADAQTSGGLLLSCPGDVAQELVAQLVDGDHPAAVVGTVHAGSAGTITVEGSAA
jgi:selenide,water dikinase